MNDNVSIPVTRVVLFPRNEAEQAALAKEFKELFDGFLPGNNGEARFTFELYDSQKSAANPVLVQLAQRLSGHRVFNAREHKAQIEASEKDADRNPLQITILGKDGAELFSLSQTNVNLFLEGMPNELQNFKPYFKKYMNQSVLTGVAYCYRQVCLEYYFGEEFFKQFGGRMPKNSELRIKCLDKENIELEFCVSHVPNADEHVKFKPTFKNKFTLTLVLKFDKNAAPQENVLPIDITLKDAKFEIEQRRGTGLLHVTMGNEKKILDKNNHGTPGLIESVIKLEDPEIQARLETVFLEAEQRTGQILLNKIIDFEQSILREDVKSTLVEQGLNDSELRPLLFNIFSTEKLRLGDVLPTLKIDAQLKLLTELFKSPHLSCLSTVDSALAKTLYPQILQTMGENNQRQFIKRLNESQKKNTIEWFGEYMLDNINIFEKTLETISYEQLQSDLIEENFFLALINNTIGNENAPLARKQNAARVKSTALLVDNIKRDERAFEQTARTLSLNHKKAIVRNLPSQISPDINLQRIFSILLDRLTPAEKLELYKSFPGKGSEKSKEAFNLNILQSPEITDFTGNNSQTLLSNSTPLELKTLAILDTSGKILAKLISGAEKPLRPYNFFERHFRFVFKQKRKENDLIEKQQRVLDQIKPNEFSMVFQTATQDSLDSLLPSRFYVSNFNKIYTSLTTLLTDNPEEYLSIKDDFTKLLVLSAQSNTPETLKKKMRELVLEMSTPSSERKYSEALTLELFKILFSKADYFKLLIVNEQKLSPEIGAALISSSNQELRALINARIKEHKDKHPGFNDGYEVFQRFPINQFPVENSIFSQKDKTTPEKPVLSDKTDKDLAETIEVAQRKLRGVNSFDVFERQEALDENTLIERSQRILSSISQNELSKVLKTANAEYSKTIGEFYGLRLKKAQNDFMSLFTRLFRAGNNILIDQEHTKDAVSLIKTPLSDPSADSQIRAFTRTFLSDKILAESVQNDEAFSFLVGHYNLLPSSNSPSISKVIAAMQGEKSEESSPRSDGSPDLTPEIERRAAKMVDIAQQLPAEASPAAEKTASQTKLHAKDQGPKDADSVTQKRHVVRGLF